MWRLSLCVLREKALDEGIARALAPADEAAAGRDAAPAPATVPQHALVRSLRVRTLAQVDQFSELCRTTASTEVAWSELAHVLSRSIAACRREQEAFAKAEAELCHDVAGCQFTETASLERTRDAAKVTRVVADLEAFSRSAQRRSAQGVVRDLQSGSDRGHAIDGHSIAAATASTPVSTRDGGSASVSAESVVLAEVLQSWHSVLGRVLAHEAERRVPADDGASQRSEGDSPVAARTIATGFARDAPSAQDACLRSLQRLLRQSECAVDALDALDAASAEATAGLEARAASLQLQYARARLGGGNLATGGPLPVPPTPSCRYVPAGTFGAAGTPATARRGGGTREETAKKLGQSIRDIWSERPRGTPSVSELSARHLDLDFASADAGAAEAPLALRG